MKVNDPRWSKVALLVLWGVTLLAWLLNINDLLKGLPANIGTFLLSVLFIAAWSAFTALNGRQKAIIMSLIYGGLVLATALICCFVAAFNLIETPIATIMMPFLLLFLTPYYGLMLIASDEVFYLVAIVSSFLWARASLRSFRAGKVQSRKGV